VSDSLSTSRALSTPLGELIDKVVGQACLVEGAGSQGLERKQFPRRSARRVLGARGRSDHAPPALDRMLSTLQRVSDQVGHMAVQSAAAKAAGDSGKTAAASNAPRQLPELLPGHPPVGNTHTELAKLAAGLVEQYDADRDGYLSLEEARALFRSVVGLSSRDRRNPGGLDRAAFEAVCTDTARGMSPSDLVELLHLGGGALGGQSYCAVGSPLSAKPSIGENRRHLRDESCAAPPRLGALSDALAISQAVRAVRRSDVTHLTALVHAGALWADPNPWVLEPALQHVLGTAEARFPLLWVASFKGDLHVWQLLVTEISTHKCLDEALCEDVDGWALPSVICLECSHPSKVDDDCTSGGTVKKDAATLLRMYFELLGDVVIPEGPALRRCMFRGNRGTDPFDMLLSLGESVWPGLVELLVRHGGGFPHDEASEAMARIGLRLASCGCLGLFLKACDRGGDAPRPGSLAFAGLFMGLLEGVVERGAALVALGELLRAGLSANGPLTHGGLWPLHAAARRDCVHLVEGLLAARASPYARNGHGLTPMDVAREARSMAAAAALQKAARAKAK